MSKAFLLNKLDMATDRAVSLAFQREFPLQVSKKSTLIGSSSIEKNENGTYDILDIGRTVVYKNIFMFDVAIIIAQRYNSHETGIIKKVLYLEERFSKYHNDMTYYLHCMKSAKKKQDIERLAILEDKFRVAELYAKETKDQISFFKRVK